MRGAMGGGDLKLFAAIGSLCGVLDGLELSVERVAGTRAEEAKNGEAPLQPVAMYSHAYEWVLVRILCAV